MKKSDVRTGTRELDYGLRLRSTSLQSGNIIPLLLSLFCKFPGAHCFWKYTKSVKNKDSIDLVIPGH